MGRIDHCRLTEEIPPPSHVHNQHTGSSSCEPGSRLVHHQQGGNQFFSSAASGIGLYCQIDAGYHPRKFVMGNIAYALGVGRGLMGSFRTLARGG